MGVNFWIQFVVQLIIAAVAITYILNLEKVRPTKEINPQTLDDVFEL